MIEGQKNRIISLENKDLQNKEIIEKQKEIE